MARLGRPRRRQLLQSPAGRSGFVPSRVSLPEEWIGPEPVGEAMAEVLSVQQGELMSGRAGPGTPYGIQGSSVDTETSYMVGQEIQSFVGPTQMGATTRLIDDPEAAFPNTHVPASLRFEDVFNPWSSIS